MESKLLVARVWEVRQVTKGQLEGDTTILSSLCWQYPNIHDKISENQMHTREGKHKLEKSE